MTDEVTAAASMSVSFLFASCSRDMLTETAASLRMLGHARLSEILPPRYTRIVSGGFALMSTLRSGSCIVLLDFLL